MASPSSADEFVNQAQAPALIPGLPNDLGALVLSFVPYPHHSRLKSTCKSWKRFYSSKSLISLRQNHTSPPQLLCIFPQDPSISSPYLYDPKNTAWCPLPQMPCNPYVYGLSNFISISLGPYLYVLGGSLFDTRSYPLDRPSPTSSAFRFDFASWKWEVLAPMITPRGSFACAAVPGHGRGEIVVAGGGSRHTMFGAAGSRMDSVELYDVDKNEWIPLDGLPRFRAGCVGFFMGREFWVMGGYGESRTVSGVFPVDEYYRDAVAMELEKNGGVWREVGDMWGEGERARLGKIAVIEDDGCEFPRVFMLDRGKICRYDTASNRWNNETFVPKRAFDDSSVGFVSIDKELYVFSLFDNVHNSTDRSRPRRRSASLFVQIYDPMKKTWRSLTTKPPFHQLVSFRTAVMCTVKV